MLTAFYEREKYEPKDLFDEVKPHINLIGGTLSVDDTVAEKPYSDPKGNELIKYFWSGNHHRPVKGINLITLYYTDSTGKSLPVNYRLYKKKEGKTKNDYFRASGSRSPFLGINSHLGDRRLLVFFSKKS